MLFARASLPHQSRALLAESETLLPCDFGSLADCDDNGNNDTGREKKQSYQNISHAIFLDFFHFIKPPCKGRPRHLGERAETKFVC